MTENIDITKPRYIRKGDCNQCGECCVNEKCEYLSWYKGEASCLIYNSKDRPEKCGIFPANPPIVFKACGYIFFDTWENKIIKAGDKL